MWVSKKKWLQAQERIAELESELFDQRVFNRYSSTISEMNKELDGTPIVMGCRAGEFEKMIHLFKTFISPLDFSEPFKMEINYDPEKTTVSRTFLTTEVLQRYSQRIMGRTAD